MKLTALAFLLVIVLGQGCTMRMPYGIEPGYVKIGNDSIYYEQGRPVNYTKTVLLLHAGFLDLNMWQKQVHAFDKHYRVVAIDLPSHGRTENDTVRYKPADFIKTVLDSLDISKACIVGVSFGAACATDFVLAHPERVDKAILVSSGVNGWDKKFAYDSITNEYLSSFFGSLEKRDSVKAAEVFTRVWFDGPYRKPQEVNDTARNLIYQTVYGNIVKHHLRGWPVFEEPPAIERLSTINLPVLVIHGDKDMPLITQTSTYLEKNIRGAKRVMIPGTAHMLNMEKPDEFNKIVMDFLK